MELETTTRRTELCDVVLRWRDDGTGDKKMTQTLSRTFTRVELMLTFVNLNRNATASDTSCMAS